MWRDTTRTAQRFYRITTRNGKRRALTNGAIGGRHLDLLLAQTPVVDPDARDAPVEVAHVLRDGADPHAAVGRQVALSDRSLHDARAVHVDARRSRRVVVRRRDAAPLAHDERVVGREHRLMEVGRLAALYQAEPQAIVLVAQRDALGAVGADVRQQHAVGGARRSDGRCNGERVAHVQRRARRDLDVAVAAAVERQRARRVAVGPVDKARARRAADGGEAAAGDVVECVVAVGARVTLVERVERDRRHLW